MPVLKESTGGYSGWWGTVYRWSPDGSTLAYARADSIGIVDEEGQLRQLYDFSAFRTGQNFSWRPTIQWSWDSQFLIFTRHGLPVGTEPAESSPVFDVYVHSVVDDTISVPLVSRSGMWAAPKFSPLIDEPGSPYAEGYVGYLQSREPLNSVNGEYNLMVADRDGSNARVIFPQRTQPGIQPQLIGLTSDDFVWSPDGRWIATIYLGNLWIVDVQAGTSYQLTFDGRSSNPVWGA